MQKRKNKQKNKYLYWTPRILAIIYILFTSMFSLDVFSEYKFPEVLIASLMHLIPTLILIAITILAWKKPKIGGYIFLAIAIAFTIWFNTYNDLIVFLIITLPILITGILFLIDSKQNS